MKGFLSIVLALTILVTSITVALVPTAANGASWTANWIWQATDGPANTWISFRKTFTLNSVPASTTANIAADSKYWMWINGKLAVFEGGLKRGPTPNDTYYDQVDIGSYLETGTNTIAILVWYFGKDGFTHKSSGKGGLLFESNVGEIVVKSDSTWKMNVNSAYESDTVSPAPNYRLAESNVRYNAQLETVGWTNTGFDDSYWIAPVEKGVAPCAPWNNLWVRPIPQWKNSGLKDYSRLSVTLPYTATAQTTITATLPYNAQITPYLDVNAPAGLTIDMRTDDYIGGNEYNVRGEYVTNVGVQQYESYGWMNGHQVQYKIPAGVTVNALKYRETGFDCNFAGSFNCNNIFFNTLWQKAQRTLYLTMRDNYMDCPDRERAQWWGDAVIEIGEAFYSLDRNSDLLAKKAISNLVEWQESNKKLFSPIPAGNWKKEIPTQMLASIGQYGFWTYYFNTGDSATIINTYPHIKDYLSLWTLDTDGLVSHRAGDWDWEDWGTNIDARVLDNCWYYMGLNAAKNMAALIGNTADVDGYDLKMTSIRNNFNRVLWKGTEYRSPGYSGDTDDRANGLAVVAGLADAEKWAAIRMVLQNHKNASPYMEKYVLEAQYIMGYENDALNRMQSRYAGMVNSTSCTTLWELWVQGGSGTSNHAWAGGPLTLLSQYGAGVAPDTAAYNTYHVLPQEGYLTIINTVVPSIKGNISVSINKSQTQYNLTLNSPSGTTAVVGIPKAPNSGLVVQSISINNTNVWQDGVYTGGVSGISWNSEDNKYYKFNVSPGSWNFLATLMGNGSSENLVLGKPVNARVSLDKTEWGKAKLVDGVETSMAGVSKGYTSDPYSTSPSSNEWVEIDLGKNTPFSRVKLFPRTDTTTTSGGSPGFPVDFTIQVKPEGGEYSIAKTVAGQANPNGAAQIYDIGSQNARYLKINVTTLGTPAKDEAGRNMYRLQLAELGLYNIKKYLAGTFSFYKDSETDENKLSALQAGNYKIISKIPIVNFDVAQTMKTSFVIALYKKGSGNAKILISIGKVQDNIPANSQSTLKCELNIQITPEELNNYIIKSFLLDDELQKMMPLSESGLIDFIKQY